MRTCDIPSVADALIYGKLDDRTKAAVKRLAVALVSDVVDQIDERLQKNGFAPVGRYYDLDEAIVRVGL